MSKQVEEFLQVMLEFLPSTSEEYKKTIEDYGEVLETVVIEDVFMPKIVNVIIENKDTTLIKRIFEYFEKVSNSKDEDLVNIFSTTVLEVLGNSKEVLEEAKRYMGPKTMQLQSEVDKELGRIW